MIAPSRYPDRLARRQRFPSLPYQYHQRSVSFQVNSGPIFDASFSLPLPWIASVDESTASQACKNGKSLKRDHRNTTCCCASPMLLRTGLGSNSQTGSPKQAPLGNTTYPYRCREDFLKHVRVWSGPREMQSSLLLLRWPAG